MGRLLPKGMMSQKYEVEQDQMDEFEGQPEERRGSDDSAVVFHRHSIEDSSFYGKDHDSRAVPMSPREMDMEFYKETKPEPIM